MVSRSPGSARSAARMAPRPLCIARRFLGAARHRPKRIRFVSLENHPENGVPSILAIALLRQWAEEERKMRSVLTAMMVCAALASAAAAQDARAKGERVYADQKCSLCHAIAGKGNAKGALDAVGSKLSADEIRNWITDAKGMTVKMKTTRKPDMKAYTLPKDDVDALVAYLGTLKK
jgi:mono/diheme cytochrome c family protein